MPTLKLTVKAIDKLHAPHPSGKQTVYWDTETRGLGVVCSGRTNQRTYIAQRDLKGGKTRRVTLGTVSGLTLDVARQRAEDVLDDLRRGTDPKAKAPSFTLQAALDGYIAARPNLRPASVVLYKRIEIVLASWLASDLKEISSEMVEARHRAIAKEIGTTTANVMMRVLRLVYGFAAERVALPPNPVTRLRRQWFAEPRRKGRVQDDELPAFYKAVTALPNRTAADYVLLMLFTGMRRKETASLRWADIDLTRKVITVPAAVTKAKRELQLPISDFVHGLLVKRRALGSASPHIFPGPGKTGRITSAANALAMVATATGIKVSVHDLRRTFSNAAKNEVSFVALKALLNHAMTDVTEGYLDTNVEELREPMARVAAKMERLCGIVPVEAKNVAKLRRGNS